MTISLRLAWRNLWRQPRRTWLTIAAIVFSNVLLIFMLSLQLGTYDLMIENTLRPLSGHLQIQAVGYRDEGRMRQTIAGIGSMAERLRQAFPDLGIAARAEAFALASSDERSYGIRVLGVEPRREAEVSSLPGLIERGRWLGDEDAAEIVVGSVLARNLQVDVGDELTLLGSGRDGSFAAAAVTIVGVYASGMPDLDRHVAEMPLGYFQDVFLMRGAGHRVVIVTPELAQVERRASDIAAWLPDGGDAVVHDWTALQPGLRQAIQADLGSAFLMYGLLVVLVAFGVLNTELMSVLERTREFGVVMALGVSPGRLGRIVLLEASLMGLVATLLGAALGTLLALWFAWQGFAYPGMDELAAAFNLPSRMYPDVTPLTVFAGPMVVFLFTLLATVYPALRLHLLQPVQAMRAA